MRKVLVLGGYGLVGSEVMRYLDSLEYQVSGLGRSKESARKAAPDAEWIIRDISELTSPQDWAPIIQEFDAVVNCAGALQSGSHDDLKKIHTDAIGALGSASAQHKVKVVQISAAGVAPDATTEFFRTKAQGDRELLSSGGGCRHPATRIGDRTAILWGNGIASAIGGQFLSFNHWRWQMLRYKLFR